MEDCKIRSTEGEEHFDASWCNTHGKLWEDCLAKELTHAKLQISAAEEILGDVPHMFKDGPESGVCVEECPGCRSVDYFGKFTK